jgi:hypothetical protein
MLKKLKNWLMERFSDADEPLPQPMSRSGAHVAPRPRKKQVQAANQEFVKAGDKLAPTIEEAGPGKNVLIRNRYVREDTGTHETLKILDDSLVDSGEETGIDPYNTGGFDRSKNWSNRFRK